MKYLTLDNLVWKKKKRACFGSQIWRCKAEELHLPMAFLLAASRWRRTSHDRNRECEHHHILWLVSLALLPRSLYPHSLIQPPIFNHFSTVLRNLSHSHYLTKASTMNTITGLQLLITSQWGSNLKHISSGTLGKEKKSKGYSWKRGTQSIFICR